MTRLRTIKQHAAMKRRRWDQDDHDQHWRQVALGTGPQPMPLHALQAAVNRMGWGTEGLLRAELESRAARAFHRPPELTPEAWAAVLAAAEQEPFPVRAIREAQQRLDNGGRHQVRALAVACYSRRDLEGLLFAGKTDSMIEAIAQVLALANGAGLAV